MTEQPISEADDLPEQLRVRRDKRERMLAEGVEPYPVGFPLTTTLGELRRKYADLATDTATGDTVGVAGRVIFFRNGGKLCFATLRAGDGTELQVMISLAKVGEQALADWKSLVDIGDHVGVQGEVITSRRGELSVLADSWAITAKALRPLPVAHKPMSEDSRVRQRYVDLIVRPDARSMAHIRSTAVHGLRDSLHRRGFIEVETPLLQAVHGGATARPFTTHYNAFDVDVYIRIALELFLKRCTVGGIDKVFELGRVLRNEGADSTHSPEFTMLEVYEAYGDYNTVGTLTRELYQETAQAVFGSTTVTRLDGTELDLGGVWPSLSLYELVSTAVQDEVTPETSVDTLRAYAEKFDVQIPPHATHGKLVEELLEALCDDQLQDPVFVRDYPLDTSPLTRSHRSKPGVTEKWDLYIGGMEVGTGYSELVDPVIQRQRLLEQSLAAAGGDPEAMQLDEDFIRALEYGMPPTGGMGMGVDRMLQVFTGRGIRETILFPFVRPE
ncbi:lysine--tRNA ligase [Fodinicola feengrottensis]|uniref:lysine--tRNA ligase n=1 Tax=Fodinicola feengrottensis TaxID=435914 RepID=UPI0031E36F80